MPNLYTLLGVTKSATAAELRSAFRKQSLKYHPDKYPQSQKAFAEARFIELTNAYDILKNPAKRKQYDAEHAEQYEGDGDSASPNDPLKSILSTLSALLLGLATVIYTAVSEFHKSQTTWTYILIFSFIVCNIAWFLVYRRKASFTTPPVTPISSPSSVGKNYVDLTEDDDDTNLQNIAEEDPELAVAIAISREEAKLQSVKTRSCTAEPAAVNEGGLTKDQLLAKRVKAMSKRRF